MNGLVPRESEPVLWLPITAFSDLVLKGDEMNAGVDLSLKRNRFFENVRTVEPDDVALQMGMSISADRALDELGVVIITRDDHLCVIAEEIDENVVLPILWNTRLVKTKDDLAEDDVYYQVYCELGMAYAVYDPAGEVFWTDEDVEKLM